MSASLCYVSLCRVKLRIKTECQQFVLGDEEGSVNDMTEEQEHSMEECMEVNETLAQHVSTPRGRFITA